MGAARRPGAVTLVGCLAFLVAFTAFVPTARAQTDVLVMPFVGVTFGGTTDLVDLADAAGQTKFLWGGTLDIIRDSGVGIEVDLGYSPGFLEKDDVFVVNQGSLTTLMGNLVVALPNRLARYTLRPYFSSGLGLMSVSQGDFLNLFTGRANLVGLDVGGGAIGFVNDTTGVRWDLRYFKNVTKPDPTSGFNDLAAKLSYWRGSMALVIRY
jgi:hypothetical protein